MPVSGAGIIGFRLGIGMIRAMRALGRGQRGEARATLLALKDGLLNRFGNQNAKFA